MDKGYRQDWLPDDEDDSLPTQVAPKRVAPVHPRVELSVHKCHVIVIYSLSGGTGKTTIATNVAAALKRESERVLLIDCALQSGDVGIFLNLQAQYTLNDLTKNINKLDKELVDNVLIDHDSGLKVLLAPRTPQDAEGITAEKVVRIIDRLRPDFDFIVVDTGSQVDFLNTALCDIADRVLLVINPNLPCVKNARNVLNQMEELHYSPDKVQLVVNRVNISLEQARVAIGVAAIENNLKRKALGIIPMDERRVLAAINRGMTIVAKYKDESPAKELIELADALYVLCKGAEVS